MHELYRRASRVAAGPRLPGQRLHGKKNFAGAINELRLACARIQQARPNTACWARLCCSTTAGGSAPRAAPGGYAQPRFRSRLIIYWAQRCFERDSSKTAEKEFREALRINASADNHYSLAACLMSLDRNAEALSELESAPEARSRAPLYRARREELLKLMKDTSR